MNKKVKQKISQKQFFLPKNRKGQFYLIAAIVIISVIVGFTGISNYSKKEKNEKINDLRDELQIETAKIMEYGINNYQVIGRSTKISELLEEDVRIYAGNSEIENMYFILGEPTKVIISAYLKSLPENLSIDDNSTLFQPATNNYESIYYAPAENKIIIGVNNIPYEFELKSGINLYFIISKGNYIATNKNG